jgi:hypothetical protein
VSWIWPRSRASTQKEELQWVLPAAQRAQLGWQAGLLCQQLPTAQLRPSEKPRLIGANQLGVRRLAQQGWLTTTRAASLSQLASKL